ncbi:MAG: trigger factor, partial [Lachnospiraceae bacterium]|nr:trigger factor [Lachnospiraceae bacterium]
AIVAAEDFNVSDDEYEKELERIAEESKMEVDKLKEYIGDDEVGKNRITDDIKIQKAIDLITDSAVEK